MDKRSRKRRANSQERWELQQLRAAGAIDQSELPEYDEETGNIEQEDSGGIYPLLTHVCTHFLCCCGLLYMCIV